MPSNHWQLDLTELELLEGPGNADEERAQLTEIAELSGEHGFKGSVAPSRPVLFQAGRSDYTLVLSFQEEP